MKKYNGMKAKHPQPQYGKNTSESFTAQNTIHNVLSACRRKSNGSFLNSVLDLLAVQGKKGEKKNPQ